ncbi:MAG: MiaB/RimO family radical SAM methylthiotransferase [Elusimicrobiota bacterium]
MKLHVLSFGCQMNEADALELSYPFLARGFEPCAVLADADAVLVNTCTVRAHAEHRAVSAVGRLEAWKAARPGRLVVVAGCAAERLGPELRRRFPFVDLVLGARSVEETPALIARALEERGAGPAATDVRPPPGISAYLTVARGCGFACAYCIVPSVRGPDRPRALDRVLEEARRLADGGARELVLLGQTVNGWKDREGRVFADLLRALAEVPGVLRLRFMSPHPLFLDEALAAAMAEIPAVCPQLHLPVQSGSDRVLAAMGRGYTCADFLSRVRSVRARVSGLALSTDLLVGFPGETAEDFRGTLSLIDEAELAGAYCFKYSPREGTPSFALADDVEPRVKEERHALLLERAEGRRSAELRSWVGRSVEVLLETPTGGRTPQFHPARFASPAGAPGTLVEAEVTGCSQAGLLVQAARRRPLP